MTRSLAILGALLVALAVVLFWLRDEGRSTGVEPAAPATAPATAQPADVTAPELVPGQAEGERESPAPARTASEPEPREPGPTAEERKGLAIAGMVVDDLGAPVTEFSIELGRAGGKLEPSPIDTTKISIEPGVLEGLDEATREELEKFLSQGVATRSDLRPFTSSDGSFRLEGLSAGQWQLTAWSYERKSAPAVVEAAENGGEVVLVLPRPAALAGVVIDAAGAAVREAGVFLLAPGEDEHRLLQDPEPQTRTDESGRFSLEGVGPGSNQLMARHPRFAESEWMEIEVAPGERRTDVVILLTSGGRIEGRLDSSLGELAGREVGLFSFRGTIGWRDAKTDASGRFVIEGVIPQAYVIELRPAGWGQIGFEDQPGIRKNITVKEGETTEVIFGEPKLQIAVRGRITSRGQPVPGLTVRAYSRDGGEDRGEEFTTGSDGRYELSLDGPGLYWFSVSAGRDSSAGFERTVPAEATVELDFEVPSASLSGRVLSADGKPLARVPVTLLREGSDEEGFGARFSSLNTASDGSFEFRLLSAGKYTLRAPDGYFFDPSAPPIPQGRMLRTGLEIDEDHSIAGLELRLPAEGRVSGRVVDLRDNPVGGAWIVLKDPDGWPLSAYWETQSDATGHFEVRSVAPGSYTAFANAGGGKQASSEAFLVEAGRTASAKVVLP